MDDSLFSTKIDFNQELINDIDNLIDEIEKLIHNNPNLHEFYEIWKKIGNRLSDKQYKSSKQQAKRKNPSETVLIRIYSVETVLIFILRCLAILKNNSAQIKDFGDVNQIERIFNSLKESKIAFLIQDDVYQIWRIDLLQTKLDTINKLLAHFLPTLLNEIKNIPSKDIFLIFHNKILDAKYRKLLGEFYTPPQLSQIIINAEQKYEIEHNSIIDLSCGPGILLLEYLNLSDIREESYLGKIIGLDINPFSVIISKFSLFFHQYERINGLLSSIEPLIFCTNSLISYAYSKINLEKNKDATIKDFIQIDKNQEFYLIDTNTKKIFATDEKKIKILIEFMDSMYEIVIPIYNSLDILSIRQNVRVQIENTLNRKNSEIYLPLNLIYLIKDGKFTSYFQSLLCDKICTYWIFKKKYDVVLGNPPYMRVQIIHPLWKRKLLSKCFSTATGHFDIYYLFVELGISLLSKSGILTYITSNKFLTTSSGDTLRRLIRSNIDIKYIINFHDSHVFNALVLPMIYVFSKKRSSNSFIYTRLKKINSKSFEAHSPEDLIILLKDGIEKLQFYTNIWKFPDSEPIEIKSYLMTNQPNNKDFEWTFVDPQFSKIIQTIRDNSLVKFGDICKKFIVGIKTTANYAFIDDYNFDFIQQDYIIEERERIKQKYGRDIFYPIIQGKDIRDFQIGSTDSRNKLTNYIFYPHFKVANQIETIPESEIPTMIEYLKVKNYYEKLKKREYIQKAKKMWYSIWNTKDPDDMEAGLKIVVPDISTKNNFAIDYKRRYVDGTAYFALLKSKNVEGKIEDNVDEYKYVLGLLNSYICEFYHKLVSGNTLYARRYRYWSTNVKHLPLIPKSNCDPVLAKKLIEAVSILEKKYSNESELEMNKIVYEIYRIDESDQKIITNWVLDNRQGK